MKASTLVVVSIALILGLVGLVVAKQAGLILGPKVETVAAKEDPIMVLVANQDLYPRIALNGSDVRVRELRSDERAAYENLKQDLMPPLVAAALNRVPKDRIMADKPLSRKWFEDEQPMPVSKRLREGMRAANVTVTKQHSAGGVIQVGEFVEVWLKARVTEYDGKQNVRSACLAKASRVISKRNRLTVVSVADADGPLNFMLEVNPYRAALLSYVENLGELTLIPVKTEGIRPGDPTPADLKDIDMPMPVTMMSTEYRGEDQRILDVLRGDYQVGDADMKRIFNIKDKPKFFTTTYLDASGRTMRVQTWDIPGSGGNGNGNGKSATGAEPPLANGSGGVVQPLDSKKDCPTCGKKDASTGLVSPIGK